MSIGIIFLLICLAPFAFALAVTALVLAAGVLDSFFKLFRRKPIAYQYVTESAPESIRGVIWNEATKEATLIPGISLEEATKGETQLRAVTPKNEPAAE